MEWLRPPAVRPGKGGTLLGAAGSNLINDTEQERILRRILSITSLVGEDPISATSEVPPRSQLPRIWHPSSAQGHILHLTGQEPYPKDEGRRWEGGIPALGGMAGG